MTDPFAPLSDAPRLLLEAHLRPMQADKIQVTNFPDLGPARFRVWRGGAWVNAVIVDSAQSMANHLEMAAWDKAAEDWVEPLRGLPYVRIDCGALGKTNTIREAHRLNSAYIWTGENTPGSEAFVKAFREAIGIGSDGKKKKKKAKNKQDDDQPKDAEEEKADTAGVLDLRRFYKAVFRWDPNSVLHGVFLEKLAGRLRMTRLLSAFMDAYDFHEEVPAPGTKLDYVSPSAKAVGLSAEDGAGNVPFHGTQFAPKSIVAYFKIDLDQLRGYCLGKDAEDLLIALGLYKVRRLLGRGFCPRSNCDLMFAAGDDLRVTGPAGYVVPAVADLAEIVRKKIVACAEAKLFADPAVTAITWVKPKKKSKGVKIKLPVGVSAPASLGEPPLAERVTVKLPKGKAKYSELAIKDFDADIVSRLADAFDNPAVTKLLQEELAKAEAAPAEATEGEEADE